MLRKSKIGIFQACHINKTVKQNEQWQYNTKVLGTKITAQQLRWKILKLVWCSQKFRTWEFSANNNSSKVECRPSNLTLRQILRMLDSTLHLVAKRISLLLMEHLNVPHVLDINLKFKVWQNKLKNLKCSFRGYWQILV